MHSVKPIQITKVTDKGSAEHPDLLAVEEPLEIRLGYGELEDRKQQSIAVTMRTPGHDEELAVGFLFTEGIITTQDQIVSAKHCEDVKDEQERGNVIRAELHPDVEFDVSKLERHFYTTSSCGVCGKSSIDAIHTQCQLPITDDQLKIEQNIIYRLPDELRKAQAVFEHTGGLHATGVFNTEGELQLLREDVGRHNAFDKVVGAMLEQNKLPMSNSIVFGQRTTKL